MLPIPNKEQHAKNGLKICAIIIEMVIVIVAEMGDNKIVWC